MHTYSKVGEKQYDIGAWLSGVDGHYFCKLFHVESLAEAITAVNILNGGGDIVDFRKLKTIKEVF